MENKDEVVIKVEQIDGIYEYTIKFERDDPLTLESMKKATDIYYEGVGDITDPSGIIDLFLDVLIEDVNEYIGTHIHSHPSEIDLTRFMKYREWLIPCRGLVKIKFDQTSRLEAIYYTEDNRFEALLWQLSE